MPISWKRIVWCLLPILVACSSAPPAKPQAPATKSLTPEQQRRYGEDMRRYDDELKAKEEELQRQRDAHQKRCEENLETKGCTKMKDRVIGGLVTTTFVPTLILLSPGGTTNYLNDKSKLDENELKLLNSNYDVFIQQMAQGEGEHLGSYLALRCPHRVHQMITEEDTIHGGAFRKMVQEDFSELTPTLRNPKLLRDNLVSEMRKHYAFHDCLNVDYSSRSPADFTSQH